MYSLPSSELAPLTRFLQLSFNFSNFYCSKLSFHFYYSSNNFFQRCKRTLISFYRLLFLVILSLNSVLLHDFLRFLFTPLTITPLNSSLTLLLLLTSFLLLPHPLSSIKQSTLLFSLLPPQKFLPFPFPVTPFPLLPLPIPSTFLPSLQSSLTSSTFPLPPFSLPHFTVLFATMVLKVSKFSTTGRAAGDRTGVGRRTLVAAPGELVNKFPEAPNEGLPAKMS